MRRALVFLALIAASAAEAQTVPVVSPQAALNYTGTRIAVCGRVASVKIMTDKSVMIALDAPYPAQLFAFQILPVDLGKFGTPELSLPDKRVCGTGTVQMSQGRAQILLKEPGQLVLQQ